MRVGNGGRTRLLLGASLVCLLVLAAACSGHDPQDTLNPQGHIAAVTKALFYPIFWIAVGVFFFIEGLLAYILIRYRERSGRQIPAQIHGNTRLELTWTAIPTLMMIGIAIPTIATLVHVDTTPANAMEIQVIGHQWWWEFDYPKEGVVTADELHIPAGVPVHVSLHSDDVIHSFWVPTLVGKQDVIPNHDGGMWFSAYQPGTYDGQCAQFCGEQHALMQLRVVADSQSDFNAWVASQKANASLSASGGSLPQAFDSDGCSGCHTIAGTTAAGKVGPNLTHFASRTWFEEMDNNADNVHRWITNPQGVKNGSDMKINPLSDQDAQSLLTLLEGLK
jgi:cytochrome c oxidase subunit 2